MSVILAVGYSENNDKNHCNLMTWMPGAVIGAGKAVAELICRKDGEQNPSAFLQKCGANNCLRHLQYLQYFLH